MRPAHLSTHNVARYASLAAFMSTLFIYSPNVMTLFLYDAAEFTGQFAEPCLIATFAASCLLIVAEICGKACGIEGFLSRRGIRVGCVALYILSCSSYIVCIAAQIPWLAQLLGPIAVVAGVTVLAMGLMWAEAFSDVDLFQATVAVVVGLLASALLHTVCTALPWQAGLALELALLVAGSLPLVIPYVPWGVVSGRPASGRPASGPFDSGSLDSEPAAPAASVGVSDEPAKPNVQAFLSVMGVPLAGMAISSLAIGIRPLYILDHTVNLQVLGMFLAVLLALPLLALRKKQPLYVYVYQVFLPTMIALATALVTVFGSGDLHEAAIAFLFAVFTLATVIAIAASSAVSNAREFPRALVFATLIAVYSGLGITGIRLGALSTDLADNNEQLMVGLAVIYTCGMLVFSSYKVWKATTGSSADDGLSVFSAAAANSTKSAAGRGARPESPSGSGRPSEPRETETFEERLAKISHRGGLSARETEIMSYVGRGHTSVYVAKTLLISDSTVYSHVRNIYKKLGITSREELIQLFNEPGE